MSFISIEFLILFLLVFAVYWLLGKNRLLSQNLLIVAASFTFYGFWDYRFLALIIASILIDYTVANRLNYVEKKSTRKVLLATSICTNLGMLAVFKYYNWFIDSLENLLPGFQNLSGFNTLELILPVGISFYTFQTLSYTIDVYRRKIEPTSNIIAFSAFVSFFPQLVAGPIERASNLLPQFIQKREFSYKEAVMGLRQILWGLIKKLVIADNCARYANLIFNNSDQYEGFTLIIGAVFFAFQIYGDFSGYSDIAIGLSRLLGFKLQKNFAYPYFSRDFAEFWRRWHISLSTWFRDYLYIPSGGSRMGLYKNIRNVFIVFLVSGLWHGANWSFVAWGGLNAIYFLPVFLGEDHKKHVDIASKNSSMPTLIEFIQIMRTFLLTVLAWIFFRAEDIDHAIRYISAIFTKAIFAVPKNIFGIEALVLVFLIAIFLFIEWQGRANDFAISELKHLKRKSIRFGFYYILIFAIIWFGAKEEPFIYFQF